MKKKNEMCFKVNYACNPDVPQKRLILTLSKIFYCKEPEIAKL